MTTEKEITKKVFRVEDIRKEFPILKQLIHDKPLVYLDNAATTQKPQVVIDTLVKYYNEQNSNIHRGVHTLSQVATKEYENARVKIKNFINAKSLNEIIFTRGATEGVNLVASTYGRKNIKEGDEVIISTMEHHSNIEPWQMLCEEKNAKLKIIPINDDGELLIDEFKKLVNEKTKFVSVVHVSNSLGTINPVKDIIEYLKMEYHEMILYASKDVIFSVKAFIKNPVRDNFLKTILTMRQDLSAKRNDLDLNDIILEVKSKS